MTPSATHYNDYRDYDPSNGRYVQSDPLGLGGGVNSYAYVDADPIRTVDPTGLVKVDLFGESPNDNEFHRAIRYYKDDPTKCLVYAHGAPKVVLHGSVGSKSTVAYNSGKALYELLISKGCKPNMPVILYSCRTGQGEDSIAKRLSKYFPSVTAPTQYMWFNRQRFHSGPSLNYGKKKDGTMDSDVHGDWRTF
jgi:hypothetical protein